MRDIRRTVATGLGKLKVPPVIISCVLDHTIQGVGHVTQVYAKYDFLEEKRQALDLWGRHLAALVKARRAEDFRPGSKVSIARYRRGRRARVTARVALPS